MNFKSSVVIKAKGKPHQLPMYCRKALHLSRVKMHEDAKGSASNNIGELVLSVIVTSKQYKLRSSN